MGPPSPSGEVSVAAPDLFVSIGDSYSAGTGVGETPWPAYLSNLLAGVGLPVVHHNLSCFGATAREIHELQLPAALELDPALVSVNCGANDVLFDVDPDVPACAAHLDEMLSKLRIGAPQAMVFTITYGEFFRFVPWRPRSKRRLEIGMLALNDAIVDITREHGYTCVDVSGEPQVGDPACYALDGIHASVYGHRLISAAALFEVAQSWQAERGSAIRTPTKQGAP